MFQSFESWRDDIAEYLQMGIDLWLEVFAKEEVQEILLHYGPDGGGIRAEVRTSAGRELLGYGDYKWEDDHIFGEPEDDDAVGEWERERGYRVPEEVRDRIRECGLGLGTMWTEFGDDSGGGRQDEMAEALAEELSKIYKCNVLAVREETDLP